MTDFGTPTEFVERRVPVHWRFIVPHPDHENVITAVEIGLPVNLPWLGSAAESSFAHELAIDDLIKANEQGRESVRLLFGLVGGIAVEAVRQSGARFLACLEVNYGRPAEKFVASSTYESARWARLIYSRVLEGSLENLRQTPGFSVVADTPTNRKNTAELMAMSAFFAEMSRG